MQKHLTLESIHAGLSGKKEDLRWSDLLNFRSSDNRTFAVPRMYKLLEGARGLHTVLSGLKNNCYALGSKQSFHFQAFENSQFLPLWRLRVEQNLREGSQADCLHIRGSYDGVDGRRLRLTVVKNRLELATINPEVIIPDEFIEPPPRNPLCPLIPSGLTKVTFVKASGAPIARAKVELYDGRDLLLEGLTSPTGLFDFTASNKTLRIRILDEDGVRDITIPPCEPDIIIERPVSFTGVEITVRYSNTEGPVPGGHACDAATYKLFGNTIDLGEVNLNNLSDGGDREVVITLTEEQAILVANGSSDGHTIDLSLECDPTNPAYDHDGGWGETCHTSLAWVIVKKSNGVEVYNGAPVGFFVSVDLS